jgi:glycosyltransferase involved in cell wall biosynthesis
LKTLGIEFLKKVSFTNVPQYIASHAVGWLPWKLCPGNYYGIPTKLLEYMALGRPVVASNLPFVSQIIERYNCGIIVPWDSPQDHAEALLYLFDHPEEAKRMGENGRKAVQRELNWESQFPALCSLYNSCLSHIN